MFCNLMQLFFITLLAGIVSLPPAEGLHSQLGQPQGNLGDFYRQDHTVASTLNTWCLVPKLFTFAILN